MSSETATIDQPATAPVQGIRFEDEAVYPQAAVARAFGVHQRSVERWRKSKRNRMPKPFTIGNVPHWKGRTLNLWLNRMAEAV